MLRILEELTPHPLNTQLYQANEEQDKELIASIKDRGLIEKPKITMKGVILSGHRRIRALIALGVKHHDCDLAMPDDEEAYIIEANRYRRKTVSEIGAEIAFLKEYWSKKAKLSQGGLAPAAPPTLDRVGEAIGVSGVQAFKINKLVEAAKTNEAAKAQLARIDKGETSINNVYTKLFVRDKKDFEPKVSNIWNFMEANDGTYHGRQEDSLIRNILHNFSFVGDTVYDPMAGSGSTGIICDEMDRKCIMYDLHPTNDRIREWNLNNGLPPGIEIANLIYLDPPYWNQAIYGMDAADKLGFDEFIEWYYKLLTNVADKMQNGAIVVLLMTTQTHNIPEEFFLVDWTFIGYSFMLERGLIPMQRISIPYGQSQYTPAQIASSLKNRFLLGRHREAVVMLKL